MEFSVKDFLSKCATFTEEILNEKRHFFVHVASVIRPSQADVPFLQPLKTSENLWFSNIFRGYRTVV